MKYTHFGVLGANIDWMFSLLITPTVRQSCRSTSVLKFMFNLMCSFNDTTYHDKPQMDEDWDLDHSNLYESPLFRVLDAKSGCADRSRKRSHLTWFYKRSTAWTMCPGLRLNEVSHRGRPPVLPAAHEQCPRESHRRSFYETVEAVESPLLLDPEVGIDI